MDTNDTDALANPPYFAAIFVSQRTPDDNGYGATAQRMYELVRGQPGFLGAESVRAPDGKGITVAFFESEAALHEWGKLAEHRSAQAEGRRQWYENYQIYYANVESARMWKRPVRTEATSTGD